MMGLIIIIQEMADTGFVIALIDVIVGCWVTLCGFVSFVINFFSFNIGGLFGSLFTMLFGVLIVLYSLFHWSVIEDYFGFFKKWIFYGAFIAYCGFSCWGSSHIVTFIFGLIIIIIGIVYMVFTFTGMERPPALIGGGGEKKDEQYKQQQSQQPAQQPAQPSPAEQPTSEPSVEGQ